MCPSLITHLFALAYAYNLCALSTHLSPLCPLSFHNSHGTFLSLHTFSVHSLSTIMFYWQLFVFILRLLNCEPLAECVDSMTLFTQFLSFCLSHITKWRLTLSYWFRNVFLIEGESTEKLLLPYITDHTVNWPHTFRKQFGKLLIKKKESFIFLD